ncbi:OmpA/MotB family protein [Candidatus Magnetaquicoccus inordinatus]|uniref:OmpA/MotB family protein n=1 Tax=Candidatus Magnetaquicoccus inordinatus TaxID=2496818 RepID=UPI00102ACE8C|nr:OmpA family protein [Candidatus Magnetaquicoccus inordinatus]
MAIRRRHVPVNQEDEGFFASMTDMMVGMLFLFILMLMFFALKFNEAAVQITKTAKTLLSAEDTRKEMLEKLQKSLKDRGISVEIDIENGILRLPENILFDRNRADLTGKGRDAIVVLGRSLNAVLPCFATIPGEDRPASCPDTPHTIEAVFVEGHTDGDGDDALNWNLSVQRGLQTYHSMIDGNPKLVLLRNTKAQAVLSVSGYGKQRPVRPNDSADNKRQNRRIDLRFIMTTPKASQLEQVEHQIQEGHQ